MFPYRHAPRTAVAKLAAARYREWIKKGELWPYPMYPAAPAQPPRPTTVTVSTYLLW